MKHTLRTFQLSRIAILLLLATIRTGFAMSAAGHIHGLADLGGMTDLIGTPVEQGGVGNMTLEKIAAITEWMDNPATRLGEGQINQMAGGKPLSPWNHRFQRHDPFAVARALSGTGKADPAIVNAARVHVLSDVATGRAAVNGHEITPAMKHEAEVILRYVRRFKRLPALARLPLWLSMQGPLIVKVKPACHILPKGGLPFENDGLTWPPVKEAPSKLSGVTKGAGIAVAVAVIGYDVWQTESACEVGDISLDERDVRHVTTAATVAGGAGGGYGGALAGAAVGTAICPVIGTAIGGVVGLVAGGVAGGAAGDGLAHAGGDVYLRHLSDDEQHLSKAIADAYEGAERCLPDSAYETRK